MRVACALSSLRTDWVVAERSTTVALATRSQGRDHGQVPERGHDAARPHVEGKTLFGMAITVLRGAVCALAHAAPHCPRLYEPGLAGSAVKGPSRLRGRAVAHDVNPLDRSARVCASRAGGAWGRCWAGQGLSPSEFEAPTGRDWSR